MFGLIRLVLCGIVFVIIFLLLRKRIEPAKVKKAVAILFIGIFFLGSTLLAFVPFENLFVTFDTPEAAYDYFTPGKSGEAFLIEGKESTFVLKSKNGTNSSLIVPKTENGWKVPIGTYSKSVFNQPFKDFTVTVSQYKDTSDYYIKVVDVNSFVQTLTDSDGTVFIKKQPSVSTFNFSSVYYAYISDFDATTYTLIVNGEAVALSSVQHTEP